MRNPSGIIKYYCLLISLKTHLFIFYSLQRIVLFIVLLGSLGSQGAPIINIQPVVISNELADRMLSSSVEDGEFPLLDMQPYSAPNTVPNDAAAPTPGSYPRPLYPATFQPTPHAAPPASPYSYDVPLLEANINLTLTDGSSFQLTNSLGIQHCRPVCISS